MPYSRYRLARAHKQVKRTSGDITLNSTSLANVDTGLDVVMAANAGDTIEYSISGYWSGEAVYAHMDVATIVAGSPVSYFVTDGASVPTKGQPAWIGIQSVESQISGSAFYTLVSGDVVVSGAPISSTVTLRLRYLTSAASNKTLRASSTDPLRICVKNLGPPDPN